MKPLGYMTSYGSLSCHFGCCFCTNFVPYSYPLCTIFVRSSYQPPWAHLGPPGHPISQGCASWARNPTGPQNTPFCHKSGRHPTIFDIRTGILRRISARISPGGSHPLNLIFFFLHFLAGVWKCRFLGGKKRPCEATPPRSNRAWKSQPPGGTKAPFWLKSAFWAGKKRPCEATPPRSNRARKSQPPGGPRGPRGP